ncbi:hypothetical protein AQ808_02935 [Burkholderia pseudomallei]|nr:hypothetical protein AQ808_02935 [Burkholderia pseudomallei]ONC76436.1 hypothetical protein AQ920_27580 [Burkholderia pseudomallei]
MKIAEGIVTALKHNAYAVPWPLTFPISDMTIDSLLREFASQDFAVFVFSPDDLTTLRKEQFAVARDNVLFEAGMFMGMHGRDRVFIVTPRGGDDKFHMPSDLSGYTSATYDHEWAKREPDRAGGDAASEVKRAIAQSSWAKEVLHIVDKAVTWEPADHISYKMKLHFAIANNTPWPVLVHSIEFDFGEQKPSTLPNVYGKRGIGIHKPEFRIGKEHDGRNDQYRSTCYLLPGESCSAWVAFDPSDDPSSLRDKLDALSKQKKLGTWTFSCSWNGRPPRTYYENM